MAFLHRHNVIHGNLTTASCMVDSHLTVKIVNWEYVVLHDVIRKAKENKDKPEAQRSMLYHFKTAFNSASNENRAVNDTINGDGLVSKETSSSRKNSAVRFAPELEHGGLFAEPTQAGDVYNFGLIIGEIFDQPIKDGGVASPPHIDVALHAGLPGQENEVYRL
jgi:serine/threonine protein kinase